MTGPDGEPNRLQREHWVDLGRDWAANTAAMEDRLRPWGEATMDHVGVGVDEQVVDIGCGPGQTTLALARAVGPRGRVTGLDISPTMLVEARRAGKESGLANVSFAEGDAQVYPFPPAALDLAFSRFGVMFFSDPVAAFSNVGAGLRTGGRLGFACWGPLADNPAQLRVRQAVARVVELPPVDPSQPGPHSLSSEGVLRATLHAAGYVDLRLELATATTMVGGTAATAQEMVEGLLVTGPAHDQLARNPALKPRLEAALFAELGDEWRPGGIPLPAAVWLVAAHWPGATSKPVA